MSVFIFIVQKLDSFRFKIINFQIFSKNFQIFSKKTLASTTDVRCIIIIAYYIQIFNVWSVINLKLKDYCIKEGKEYLLKEWDDEKIFRSPRKQSVIQVHCLYGGNAKKVIHGRHS